MAATAAITFKVNKLGHCYKLAAFHLKVMESCLHSSGAVLSAVNLTISE